MTVISNSRRFVFVHVPKCAGSSITRLLSKVTEWNDIELGTTPYGKRILAPYAARFGLQKHSTAAEIRAVMGAGLWNEYVSFAAVRNPFARAVSTFQYLKDLAALPNRPSRLAGFGQIASFDAYLESPFWTTDGFDGLHRPQVQWLYDGDTLMVDRLLRVETLDADIARLVAEIDLAPLAGHMPPRANASRPLGRVPLSAAAIAEVIEKHRADFERFGYPLEPPAGLVA